MNLSVVSAARPAAPATPSTLRIACGCKSSTPSSDSVACGAASVAPHSVTSTSESATLEVSDHDVTMNNMEVGAIIVSCR